MSSPATLHRTKHRDRGRIGAALPRFGLLASAAFAAGTAALARARASDVFAAGVDYAGVHDWSGLLKVYASAGAQSASDSLAWASSPLSSVKRWHSPVLVIQADDDHNVPFDQSVLLTKALREQKVPHELIVIPNEIHDLLLHRSWLTYFHAQSDFLDKYLLR